VGYRCPFCEKGIRETTPLEGIVFFERRMKEIFALSFFADNQSGLVVADLDNVGFGHVFCFAGRGQHPLMCELFDLNGSVWAAHAQQQQQQTAIQQPLLMTIGGERKQDSWFFIAVSIAEPTRSSWSLAFDDAAQVSVEITAEGTTSCRRTHQSFD
jgi:hypothetical protein